MAGLLVLAFQACLTERPPENPAVESLGEADALLEAGRCGEAMRAFETIISEDSTLSLAYTGYAKATLCFFDVDTADIYSDLGDTTVFALLQHPDSVLTQRLQATSRVLRVYDALIDRDTLSRHYLYVTENTPSAEALADSLYDVRRGRMQDYLARSDLGMPGYRPRSAFPLTDFTIGSRSVYLAYTVLALTRTVTRLYDLDRNDTIDARDSLMKKLKFGGNGSFSIDSLSNLGDELGTDSLASANLNDLILKMQNGLDSSLCALLVGGCSSPDGDSFPDTSDADSPNMDSVIASLGETILFYQFGDGKDNDGDGCIDEEILDQKDNDLDGFVDEDARVIQADKPDGVDNDRDGRMDPVNPAPLSPYPAGNDTLGREAPVGDLVYPGRGHVLGFVHAYLAAQNELGLSAAATSWVKIKKDASAEDMALRLAVQRDSLAARIPVGGPVPDSLAAKLQHAKTVIGGCWRNYP